MFYIDWTDPTVERVGQRRARKVVERELRKREDEESERDSILTRTSSTKKNDDQSGRESILTRRSSASGERSFNLLGGLSLRKSSAKVKGKQSISSLSIVKNETTSRDNPASIKSVATISTTSANNPSIIYDGGSPVSPVDESITDSTPVQLSPPSIPASTSEDIYLSPPRRDGSFHGNVPLLHEGFQSPGCMSSDTSEPLRPKNPLPNSPSWPKRLDAYCPESWMPPETWDNSPSEKDDQQAAGELHGALETECMVPAPPCMDLAGIQTEITRMAAQKPCVVLARLNEELRNVGDASIYRELEMERKRWMLSSLQIMEREKAKLNMPGIYHDASPKQDQNILALFESPGVLHLTLIDPYPVAHSIGPRMRKWLDENLIINLEAQFRCISPVRVFPVWLADARLRAEGSFIAKAKFPAIYFSTPTDKSTDPEIEDKRIEVELQSTVGRMLWEEVWGRFVTGETWWWKDSACIEECLRLGTYWEYYQIEAVKDN
ncbi:hypothetical protein B0T19DRAFT_461269 [Cercophora scortea]|uniref:Uncharacterized protein n=1 Tax=Cercophora scortea TaxID=314031 RepID=A0AAE0MDR7_9PEZI|nr:hypothetical protein B0T19DRAFT_461269 [Cercophora scortea]